MRKTLTKEQIDFLNDLPAKYGDMLTKYAYRFFGYQPHMLPVAQDAVQETYVKAVKYVDVLMAHENQPGWLIVSLRNTLLSLSRSMRSKKEELMADVSDTPAISKQAAMDALERWEQQHRLADVIAAVSAILTPDEQTTFRDHFLMGHDIRETARIEGVTIDTVRGRVDRIHRKMKKYKQSLCFLLLFLHYFN